MKKLMVAVAIGFLAMSTSFASGNPELAEEINEKVTVDLSDIELDAYEADYVFVNFKIVNGEIKIMGAEGSQVKLKVLIIKHLLQLKIEADYNPNFTYRYKFTFEKV